MKVIIKLVKTAMGRINILSAILDFILMFSFHYHCLAWPWKHKFRVQNEQYISYATQVMIIYRLFGNGGFWRQFTSGSHKLPDGHQRYSYSPHFSENFGIWHNIVARNFSRNIIFRHNKIYYNLQRRYRAQPSVRNKSEFGQQIEKWWSLPAFVQYRVDQSQGQRPGSPPNPFPLRDFGWYQIIAFNDLRRVSI